MMVTSTATSLLLSILPPAVLSLVLPHLDLTSLLHLEQTCALLRQVVSLSGEYARRCRARGLGGRGQEADSLQCKHQLLRERRTQRTARTTSVTDHRVSQNLCYSR